MIPYEKNDLVFVPNGLLNSQDDLVMVCVAKDIRQDMLFDLSGTAVGISRFDKQNAIQLHRICPKIQSKEDLKKHFTSPNFPVKPVEFDVEGVKGVILVNDLDPNMFEQQSLLMFSTEPQISSALIKVAELMNQDNGFHLSIPEKEISKSDVTYTGILKEEQEFLTHRARGL